MPDTRTITVRLTNEIGEKLDELARNTQRSRSSLAAEAIADYVHHNAWQVAEIGKAVEEAEGGDFADEAEVAKKFSKCTE